jgi:hypothetical protein
MAKEQDQTQETEDTTATAVADEQTKAEEAKATEAAVKTSKDFDAKIDAEDVEETPSEDEDKAEAKPEGDKKDVEETPSEEDPSGEQEPETQDATDTGEAAISKELAQKAIDLGLTEEEVKDFDSEESLTETIKAITDVVTKQEPAVESAPAAGAAEEPQAKTKTEPEDDTAFKLENEDDIDPSIVKAFKALEQQRQEDRAEIAALKETVKTATADVQQHNRNQYVARFDGYVKDLGLEFADIFGVGPTDPLPDSSRAFQNRDEVSKMMATLGAAMPNVTDEKVLFDRAVNVLFKDKVDTVRGARMLKKTTRHAKGARMGRSATKTTGAKTGLQKAYETSKAFDEKIDTAED